VAANTKGLGVLISPYPDLLSDVFCLMVRIFLLMLVLFYIYINSVNIPPIMIINKIYETQNLLSLWLFSFLVKCSLVKCGEV